MVVHNTVPGTATRLQTILTKQSLRLLLSFELSGPNNIPQDCSHIHTVVHNTVPGTAFVLWTTVTKQQAPRLWPYSCSCTTYSLSLWDCCSSSNHFDQTKVPGTVTRVYENATYSPQDCKLIHMVVHNTAPGTAALLRTMPTKQSRGPLKQSLVILLSSFDSKWPNSRSPDCHHIHIIEQHTVSGKAAVLRSMLTKPKSQGPLLGFTRMLHTVHKTVSLFIWWCTTQSLGLLPFFKPYWPNSPGDRYQGLREFHIQSPRL